MRPVTTKSRGRRRFPAAVGVLVLLGAFAHLSVPAQSGPDFGATIELLSESGGYFDTDNLISNERSYLHVLSALRDQGVQGGVYLGVGPDQNFSYIAQIRPSLAFIVDIRRDNMLLHLLFKALFALSEDRAQYLAALFARPPPPAGTDWARMTDLVAYIDANPASPDEVARVRREVDATVRGFGITLTESDYRRVAAFHQRFIVAGLALRFQSTGRPPRFDYPTYRDLLLETDRTGRQGSFLASDDAFGVVKRLQDQDAIVPVVGNVAGERALAAIARQMRNRGERLSAFYTSNVELYLTQDRVLPRFLDNLAALPRRPDAVLIRSIFRTPVAESVPGYLSASIVRAVEPLLAAHRSGRIRGYWDLVAAGAPP